MNTQHCAPCERARYRERFSGVVQPLDLGTAPESLASNASARTAHQGQLWWRTTNSLCLSSGARLLADLQAELGVLERDRQAFWGRDLFPLLQGGLRSVNPAITVGTLPTAATTTVDRDWLRAAIWYVYHRAEFPAQGSPVVTLPTSLELPLLGADHPITGYGAGVSESRCLRGFTRELPLRPVVYEAEVTVVGQVPTVSPTRRTSSTGALAIAAVVALALLVAK